MMDINTFKNIIFSAKYYWKQHVLAYMVNCSNDLEEFIKFPHLDPFHNLFETLDLVFRCFQGKSRFISEKKLLLFLIQDRV